MMNVRSLKLAHILLVEDNEGDILLTLDAFEESKVDIKVSVVRNGQEALDFLNKEGEFADAQRPDLILLDINIPIYNGLEVLEKIKNDQSLKRIPVIMLTTSSNQKDVESAYKNYCNSYIKKPLEMDDFLAAIKKIEEFWLQLTILSA
ncbi:response regulator [Belliella aquatica]|uniref:Two-component system response regulator n=1 Tax=Belliella aquatica TaxID=1323734 RepID=A0ABQ1N2I5_9BACT|nr:response regulator [Belliella aquatica]MCH7407133.1 response regulator [Belliella aquatica]GGC51875.1 two-component system response regulator [Belliella aquatica]